MILSDREIRVLMRRGRIGIDPFPPDEAWTSTAVDLTLAARYAIWQVPPANPGIGGRPPRFCPGSTGFKLKELADQFTVKKTATDADPIVVEPGKFVLGWTTESLSLPFDSRVAARVEGKSSLARLGLGIHVTAPTIHAGFGGEKGGQPIQLEIWNTGPLEIELPPGIRICQLIFEEVHGTPEQGYAGQFSEQGPGG